MSGFVAWGKHTTPDSTTDALLYLLVTRLVVGIVNDDDGTQISGGNTGRVPAAATFSLLGVGRIFLFGICFLCLMRSLFATVHLKNTHQEC